MEAQTNLETYLEQGKQALAHGKGRDAAVAYAHAAQMEPTNPLVHLGLAEANLALGSYGVVHMASRKTQEIAPSGPLYALAQALLDLLDRRYDRALQATDAAIQDDPGNAYAHALRAYLLRMLRMDYDAGLARSRALRLSFGGKFEGCFPVAEPIAINDSSSRPINASASVESQAPTTPPQSPREQVPAWSRSGNMQRQMVRTRFWLSQNPRFATTVIIGLNVLVYLVLAVMSRNFITIDQNALLNMGAQVGFYVAAGQYWRIFTAMFLHFDITHIALNMLSLYFVGSAVEIFYGKWRYLVIYLLTGLAGGIVTYFLLPQNYISAGASGAIAGIFGALGAFFFVNRRALGSTATNLLGQWGFWLFLNVAFDFSVPGIGWQDHLGGLIAGLILGVVLLPPLRRRVRRV